ncbi:MAG TPA: hypothetical protein VLA00_13555 [Xanthobacteraceae bacterium]|nr:hypothetical protein [Xanthobacteraceae bacterium]
MAEPLLTTLAVSGLIDPAEAARAEAALRKLDPAAQITVALEQGLVSVRSDRTADALCAALEAEGFAAAPSRRRPRRLTFDRVAPIIGRAVLFALLWTVLGAIGGFGAALLNMAINPQCGAGDSGGCAMAIPAIAVLFAMFGAALGALVTLVRGVLRVLRAPV